jgi:hypothetical protein
MPQCIEDQRIGDDRVHHLGGALALAHAVADHLAAAEFHLLAVDRVVLLDLDPQFGIGQAHPVARGGAEHLRIGLPGRRPPTRPPGLTRLEADRGAGGDVEAEAAGGRAVESPGRDWSLKKW